MCLFSRPAWEDDVVFSTQKRKPRRRVVSETIIRERHSSPRSVQYIQTPPPRASAQIIKPATPPPPPSPKPKSIIVPATPTPPPPPAPAPPSPARIELVSVEEDVRSQARSSRSSVGGKKSRAGGSTIGEEVYIERERERVRMNPSPRPAPVKEEYDTYRYVEGVGPREERRRSRSITYESSPRVSGRVTERERERVVVEDEGRRREYYRRP